MRGRIATGSSFEAAFGYSRAVIDGDMIYVSGTTGYDFVTMAMPPDAGSQAANALKTIEATLAEAGATLRDVLRVRCYLTDEGDAEAVGAVVGAAFRDIRPAATMVVCGLLRPDMRVEIEATARRGAGD